MAWSRKLGAALLVVLAVALIALGWWTARSPGAEVCYACGRPTHENSRTVVTIAGKSQILCCPACALTFHQQTAERVEFTELTDFQTGNSLSPGQAFLVRGSNVNLCTHQHALVDDRKEAILPGFDRCSPSMIAFGSRADAQEFERRNGGILLPFADVEKALAASRP